MESSLAQWVPSVTIPRLVGKGWSAGTEASSQRHEAFLEVATRRFPRVRLVTHAEAWVQALPGPVTQFPNVAKALHNICFSALRGIKAWLLCVCGGHS